MFVVLFFFFQAEDGIRDHCVTGVQTCALPISNQVPGKFANREPSTEVKVFSLNIYMYATTPLSLQVTHLAAKMKILVNQNTWEE